MQFFVSQLRDAHVLEQEESINAQDIIDTPPAFVSFRHPLKTKAHANMTEDGEIVVMGRVKTVVTYQCGRCLEFFEKPVDLDFQQVVTSDSTVEVVDVNEEIRETLLIDLPVRAICRESCKGICASCGKNRNTAACTCDTAPADPRWNALKEFPFK